MNDQANSLITNSPTDCFLFTSESVGEGHPGKFLLSLLPCVLGLALIRLIKPTLASQTAMSCGVKASVSCFSLLWPKQIATLRKKKVKNNIGLINKTTRRNEPLKDHIVLRSDCLCLSVKLPHVFSDAMMDAWSKYTQVVILSLFVFFVIYKSIHFAESNYLLKMYLNPQIRCVTKSVMPC